MYKDLSERIVIVKELLSGNDFYGDPIETILENQLVIMETLIQMQQEISKTQSSSWNMPN